MTTEAMEKAPETALQKPVKLEDQIQVWETEKGEVKLSVALIRMYFCASATTVEAMTFLNICKYQKLNPWLREAYLIKYGSYPAALVVGKDTFTKRADRHPKFKGYEAGIIVLDKRGNPPVDYPLEVVGCFHLKTQPLVGGWARVWREGRDKPIEIKVSFEEYVGVTREGEMNRQWAGKPATMIRKVALVQALREAFPEEFEGMYDEAEIRPDDKRPEGFEMPLSVAEAQAKASEGNGGTSEAQPLTLPVAEPGSVTDKEAEEAATRDHRAPSPEEQAAIRSQEQAEAAQHTPPPPCVKADRGKVFNAVLRKAKAEHKQAATVMQELMGKSNMSDLDDAGVTALGKKLGL